MVFLLLSFCSTISLAQNFDAITVDKTSRTQRTGRVILNNRSNEITMTKITMSNDYSVTGISTNPSLGSYSNQNLMNETAIKIAISQGTNDISTNLFPRVQSLEGYTNTYSIPLTNLATVTHLYTSTSNGWAGNELISADGARSYLTGGFILYNVTNLNTFNTNWYTASETTNDSFHVRTYSAVTNGQYLGTGIMSTTKFYSVYSPMVVQMKISWNYSPARAGNIWPEFYWTTDGTNFTEVAAPGSQALKPNIATNTYTFVINYANITNSLGILVARRARVDGIVGTVNISIYGSGSSETASTISFPAAPSIDSSLGVRGATNSILDGLYGSYDPVTRILTLPSNIVTKTILQEIKNSTNYYQIAYTNSLTNSILIGAIEDELDLLGSAATNKSTDFLLQTDVLIHHVVGTHSANAIGPTASAVGWYSVAIGNAPSAGGASAVAVGSDSSAGGINSVALGYQANAAGQAGVALGFPARAIGQYSTSIGYLSTVTGNNSVAIGYLAVVPENLTDTTEVGRGIAMNGGWFHYRGFPIIDTLGYISGSSISGTVSSAISSTNAENLTGMVKADILTNGSPINVNWITNSPISFSLGYDVFTNPTPATNNMIWSMPALYSYLITNLGWSCHSGQTPTGNIYLADFTNTASTWSENCFSNVTFDGANRSNKAVSILVALGRRVTFLPEESTNTRVEFTGLRSINTTTTTTTTTTTSTTTTTQPGWNDPDTYSILLEMETTNTTQALDTSGNSNHATMVNAYWQGLYTNQNGRVEHNFNFVAGGSLNTAALSLSATTMTATCWIYVNSSDLNQNGGLWGQWITSLNLDWLLYLGEDGGSGRLKFYINQSDNTVIAAPASGTIPVDQWLHVACIADGSKIRLYTNTVECETGTTYNGTLRNTSSTVDAAALKTAVYNYRGKIDNCTYSPYPRSLTNITNEFLYTHPTNNIRVR
jgi:hypothetical protein